MSATDDRGSYLLDLLDHEGIAYGDVVEVQLIGSDVELRWPCGETLSFNVEVLDEHVWEAYHVSKVSKRARLPLDDLGMEWMMLRHDQGWLIATEQGDVAARFSFEQVDSMLFRAKADMKAVVE